MLSPYRRVLSRPGALAFSSSAVIARLPSATVSLGLVLLVEQRTGSYGIAGTVSAAYVLAQALMAIVHGRLLDRLGQSRVLPVAMVLYVAMLSATVVSVESGASVWLTYLLAAGAGASVPQIGASVRARWSALLESRRDVQTAFALESVLDELVFVVGPVLITTMATLWSPVLGLVVALTFGTVGVFVFAAQRRTEPPARGRMKDASGPRPPLGWLLIAPLFVVSLAQGMLFGVAEVATVALADAQGSAAAAGPLLGAWALGSLIGGLVAGTIAWRASAARRVQIGMVILTAAIAPLVAIQHLGLFALVLFVSGLAIAPTMIATLTLVEETVPASRLTEGMSVIQTGIVAGVAPGAALGGVVIDAFGASTGFWVGVVAGVVGSAAALFIRSTPVPAPEPELSESQSTQDGSPVRV